MKILVLSWSLNVSQISKISHMISILTPTYNRALFLPETIESVLNQSYENFELIIIDDGSKDGTDQVVKKYNDERISYYYHENIGETATVNKGISLAKGEIICIVNSDDPLLPGAMEEAIKIMENDPDILAVYPDWVEIGANSEFIRYITLKQYDIVGMLTDFNVGVGPGTFIRNSAFKRFGFRNPELKYTGDLEFWMRLALVGRIIHIPKFLATHRTHQGSASVSAKGKAISDELIKVARITLSSSKLSSKLVGEKDKILANAYEIIAKNYYGDNKGLFIKNIAKSYQYAIKNITTKCSKMIFSNLKLVVWNIVYRIIDFGVSVCFLFVPILRRIFDISPTVISNPASIQKFVFCTDTMEPMESEKAVAISRFLHNLDQNCYYVITQPIIKIHKNGFKKTFSGRHIELPIEKTLPYYSSNRLFCFINLMWKSLQGGIRIAKIIKNKNITSVIVEAGSQIGPISTCIASQLLGCRFYIYYFEDYTEKWWADKTMYPIMKIIDKIIARLSTGLIVPNEFMHKELMYRHNKLPTIVHNPTSHTICKSISPSNKFEKNDRKFKEIKLVFTGIIDSINLDTLKNIASAIARINDLNIKLYLYTPQSVEVLSDNLICEKIVLHTQVSPNDYTEAQMDADILLLPFTFEKRAAGIIKTFSTFKLADYLQAGKPILALCPYDSFLGWYFTKHDCGLIVTNNDVQLIIETLYHLLHNQKLKMRLSVNAMKRAMIDFEPEKSQKNLLDAIGMRI
jgi:glycosyltransferase involved in cell wall biosynthesis